MQGKYNVLHQFSLFIPTLTLNVRVTCAHTYKEFLQVYHRACWFSFRRLVKGFLCVFYLLVYFVFFCVGLGLFSPVCFVLSVPVQVIVWKDLSLKWPVMSLTESRLPATFTYTGCIQLLEILQIYWNLKTFLEISWNLIGPPGNFCVRCRRSTALVSSQNWVPDRLFNKQVALFYLCYGPMWLI